MMKSCNPHVKFNNQKGAATLLVTLLLLIAVTIATLFTGRVNLQEQRISGNEYRSMQAFNNAEKSMEEGWAYLSRNVSKVASTAEGGWAEPSGDEQKWIRCDGDNVKELCGEVLGATAILPDWLIYPDAYTQASPESTVHFVTENQGSIAPEPLPTIHLFSEASSDDGTAMSQQQITLVSASPFSGDPPDVPIVAGGNIELSGSLDIEPRVYEAELGDAMSGIEAKALAGGDILIGGSLDPDPNAFPDGETELQGNIWESLFNIEQDELKAEIESGNVTGEVLNDCSSLSETSSGIKWIEGDCDINSNGVIGPDLSGIDNCDDLSTEPLWLIIEGEPSDKSKFNGNVNVWATILFLSGGGELELTGNPIFRGSIFAEDDIDFGAGNFQSRPNPLLLNCPGQGLSFFLVKQQGSWFDNWTQL